MRPTTIEVMLTLALSLLAAPLTIDAQQPGKMPRIGHLTLRAGPAAEDEAFKQGLHALGWVEGQNLAIEYRWADGQVDRFPPWQRSWSACRWTSSSRGRRQRFRRQRTRRRPFRSS
jgi:hypothetical protein